LLKLEAAGLCCSGIISYATHREIPKWWEQTAVECVMSPHEFKLVRGKPMLAVAVQDKASHLVDLFSRNAVSATVVIMRNTIFNFALVFVVRYVGVNRRLNGKAHAAFGSRTTSIRLGKLGVDFPVLVNGVIEVVLHSNAMAVLQNESIIEAVLERLGPPDVFKCCGEASPDCHDILLAPVRGVVLVL